MYDDGEEQGQPKPWVTVAAEMVQNLSAFGEEIHEWSVVLTAQCKGTSTRKIKAIVKHLRRVYDDQEFSGRNGVKITGMIVEGATQPKRTEGMTHAYEATLTYTVFTHLVLALSEAVAVG